MKILYTYNGLTQKVSGVSRYFYEIITRLNRKHKIEVESFYLTNLYFNDLLTKHSFGLSIVNRSGRLRKLVEDFCLFCYLLRQDCDIIHNTGEAGWLHRFTKKPIVVTVHDMIPELFYKTAKARHKRRYSCFSHADAIICISENTKKDLLQIYPELSSKPLKVIYHGHTYKTIEYKRLVKEDYILYVGSRYSEYKNFLFMLEAIHNILLQKKIKLICTGNPFSEYEKEVIDKLNISNVVECVGVVSDSELASLYHYAICFVYPSKYEGFGIPVLEAFSHSCPICISNTSCFPEVAGDAAVYFNPNDANDMRQAILLLVESEEARLNLISKGKNRLKMFSWDKAAQETEQVYMELMKNRSDYK